VCCAMFLGGSMLPEAEGGWPCIMVCMRIYKVPILFFKIIYCNEQVLWTKENGLIDETQRSCWSLIMTQFSHLFRCPPCKEDTGSTPRERR
jgi:hypothetical protein